jgi:hypothetical protein
LANSPSPTNWPCAKRGTFTCGFDRSRLHIGFRWGKGGNRAHCGEFGGSQFTTQDSVQLLRYFKDIKLDLSNPYGFKATFNPTFSETSDPLKYWISPSHYGLNQGPIVLMIENSRSGLLWSLMRQCPHLVNGLRRAGFSGGWLDGKMP